MAIETHKDREVWPFETAKDWMQWLEKRHTQTDSIWIKLAKKKSGVASVTYEEAREAALMYGWIDGLINGLDETHYLILFSPRRPKSIWSKINRRIAEELIGNNKMKPSGLKQINEAKQDGRWDAAY